MNRQHLDNWIFVEWHIEILWFQLFQCEIFSKSFKHFFNVFKDNTTNWLIEKMTDGFINNENNELLQNCLVSKFPC